MDHFFHCITTRARRGWSGVGALGAMMSDATMTKRCQAHITNESIQQYHLLSSSYNLSIFKKLKPNVNRLRLMKTPYIKGGKHPPTLIGRPPPPNQLTFSRRHRRLRYPLRAATTTSPRRKKAPSPALSLHPFIAAESAAQPSQKPASPSQ